MMTFVKSAAFLLLTVLLALLVWHYGFKPKPIKIDATPAVADYQLCCMTSAGEPLCTDKSGNRIAPPASPLVELGACDNDREPQNKADFSRHQILTPDQLMAVSTCCEADAHQKRCQLLNGNVFSMPLAADETKLPRCAL